ncbi:MAG: undecaprenyldiphospho-muramoylpentapeptide beta-N-acetylglucosaminyltransferase [Pseudomonadota bacterium]
MTAGPRVLVMAGGTGGHVYPALALADELIARGCRVEWMGTRRGLEARVVPGAGIPLHCLSVRGVRGKDLWHKLTGLAYLALASLQALWLMLRLWPRCVVGMGGYAAGPGGVAAWLLRRPLLIHEQNAIAGTTNRMLAPLARRVLTGFPTDFRKAVACEVVGNPLRKALLDAASDEDAAGAETALHLLVLGGSLGAKPINDLMPEAVRRLLDELGPGALKVRHQAGNDHADVVAAAYGDLASKMAGVVEVMAFCEDMPDAYRWADLVVCRAGALTVSELAVMAKPAILIPLPHAIDDHQSANARYLSDEGAGLLRPQAGLNAEALAEEVARLAAEPELLAAMAAKARILGRPEATMTVADHCQELSHGR